MQKLPINVCYCDGHHKNFPIGEYRFDVLGTISLPELCPNSDLGPNQLLNFESLLETTTFNINWTFQSLWVGQIKRVQKDLYFYSYRDLDETGDLNFYVNGSLMEVVECFLSEWNSDSSPDWRKLFKDWAVNGIPEDYDSSKLTAWTDLIKNPKPGLITELEGLEISVFMNLADSELLTALKKL